MALEEGNPDAGTGIAGKIATLLKDQVRGFQLRYARDFVRVIAKVLAEEVTERASLYGGSPVGLASQTIGVVSLPAPVAVWQGAGPSTPGCTASTVTGKITVHRAGVWRVDVDACVDLSSVGLVRFEVFKNNGTLAPALGKCSATKVASAMVAFSESVVLAAGDQLDLRIGRQTGSTVADWHRAKLAVTYEGPTA